MTGLVFSTHWCARGSLLCPMLPAADSQVPKRGPRIRGVVGLVLMGIGGNIFSGVYLVHQDLIEGTAHWPIYFNYATALVLCLTLLALKVYDWHRGIPNIEFHSIKKD